MADSPRPDSDDTDRVPNPHRDEPLPAAQEGMREGADQTVRPEQDEPLGPLAGLVTASAAEVKEEAADVTGEHDDEAEALLASMGVEDEGIEGGQLLGLVAATLLSVAAIAVVLIYLFYIPFLTQVDTRAAGAVQNYEQQDLRTEALAKLSNYTRTDATYGLPIGRAMGLVALDYAGEGASDLPTDRAGWNTMWPVWNAAPAVQASPAGVETTRPASAIDAALDAPEAVGIDGEYNDTVELIENDGEIDADDARLPALTPEN
ncbi:hypothetical protein [Rubrivirga sp. IMCC43871]|uniref:hypothetical protein n=1 Tax=Rubrivirga sp. IMCC43871 TaxID=3391575 RepID=UPI0039901F79